MKGSRAAALLVGLTAALTLAACGVPPSGVIQAGEPATGIQAPRPKPAGPAIAPFYFLHNGELAAYPRKFESPGDFAGVVGSLFDGPTAAESLTATTELPRLGPSPDVTLDADTLTIRLPDGIAPLSHPAMLQLACTVAQVPAATAPLPPGVSGGAASVDPSLQARNTAPPSSVRVVGDGWTLTQSDAPCPNRPQQ
ncbi:hypothetical protein ACFYXS_15075 [Streptomyces sp. NPDC002574]|uniref:hypothetical protein n=1 Tax=Streptomyces sp. NPDC002574 TaxID=3364652 RepID=UPI0036B8DCE7